MCVLVYLSYFRSAEIFLFPWSFFPVDVILLALSLVCFYLDSFLYVFVFKSFLHLFEFHGSFSC